MNTEFNTFFQDDDLADVAKLMLEYQDYVLFLVFPHNSLYYIILKPLGYYGSRFTW